MSDGASAGTGEDRPGSPLTPEAGEGQEAGTSRLAVFTAAFAACALLLLASLANFLVHNDYPLLRPEVLMVSAALLACSLVAGGLYLLLPRWGRWLLEGLLAALFVELNTTSLLLGITVGVAVAAIAFWKRTSLAGPMAFFGAIVLFTTLLGLGGRTPWIHGIEGEAKASTPPAGESRPAILHMILDEQIGIEGLPSADPEAARLREELKSFFVERGFATYGGAYSEHMRTKNALPHVLNYGARLGGGMRGRKAMVGPTTHLESLVDQGYRLTILQSDYADFCTGARFHECVTYETSSPTALLPAQLGTAERAGLIGTKFLSLSEIVSVLRAPWRMAAGELNLPKLDPRNLGRSTSVATLEVFDDLTRRLANARPGEVYFAHLLLPHYPYALDASCGVLRWWDWKRPFAADLTVRRTAYAAQERCTLRKIDAVLDALERSPAGRNAVVIIHGDHGSRISSFDPKPENIGKFDRNDLLAEYSTLFAVRSPRIEGTYSSEPQPIHALLKDFAESRFTKAPAPAPPARPSVHLDGPDGAPAQRIVLPLGAKEQQAPPS